MFRADPAKDSAGAQEWKVKFAVAGAAGNFAFELDQIGLYRSSSARNVPSAGGTASGIK
jgi:hypothetical protein